MAYLHRLSLVLLLVACNAGDPDEVAVAPNEDCERPDVTWQTYADGFFRNWCTGCHSSELAPERRNGAPPGFDFDDVGLVRDHSARILARATGDEPTMPPSTGPSHEELHLLQTWFECGTPD